MRATLFNELLFLLSIFFVFITTVIALKLGKSYLTSLIISEGLIANIFLVKEIKLFGLAVSAADVFIIGIILGINLLEEFFDKESASLAINGYLYSLFIFFIFRTIHTAYEPTIYDTTHESFNIIFQFSSRIILATFLVSFCSLHLDRFLYRLLSKFLGTSYLPLKNFITGSISQLFDTVAFSYIAVYGLFSNIYNIIFFSYLIKIITLLLLTPFLIITKKYFNHWNKESETQINSLN